LLSSTLPAFIAGDGRRWFDEGVSPRLPT